MNNALPMVLLRPSCAALRPGAPVAHQWSTVTRAFARRFCSKAPNLESDSRLSLLAVLQSHKTSHAHTQLRSFSSTPRSSARVSDPPNEPVSPGNPFPSKKRTVQIGPLPTGRVDNNTIKHIFGPGVTPEVGNDVLRILHHRRTSGSLADYGVANLGSGKSVMSQKVALRGLEWLRTRFPIDEGRAAEAWAEKEANRISYELWLADPENESKYKDPERVWQKQQQKKQEEEMEEMGEIEEREGRKIGMLHVGPSQFERNIIEKRRERLEAQARKDEEKEQKEKENMAKLATGEWVRTPSGKQLMKPGQTTYVDVFGREQVSLRKEIEEKARNDAQLPYKDLEELLKATTLTQRLYPMTAFVLVLCLASFGFAHYYSPPSAAYRLIPDVSPTVATIGVLIAINIGVAVLWRIPALWPFMTRYCTNVVAFPRAIGSIANVFSHIQFDHLISNMLYLALIGAACHDLVGRGAMLGTYLSAGAVGSLASLYWANLGRGSIVAHSVGASAAIWGIASLYLLLTDQDSLKVPLLKDATVPFWPKMLWAAFFAMECSAAWRGRGKVMDHASHFGGIAVGVSVAGYMRATGFHERRKALEAEAQMEMEMEMDGVQQRAGIDAKTLDVGAMVKEEFKEVKEEVKKVVR
ncbi:hypothetical protein BDV95DRAFT_611418 [Massariosphaeria phaeospora]|uniref:Peptidase S54 rhomboid domain-containing protein n=1 Tax=Massariosphaeria phaeospora TaxID=100035 RepID=A0A7C8HZW4_9PLEO|nr:hypothetical protein BDV95DRAFT_611418 [Massariosphaeria phaeospora]